MSRPRRQDIVRTLGEFEEPDLRAEVVRPVRGARCVFMDVAALRRDFPALMPESPDPPARRRLADWLTAGAAVISGPQAAQTTVNTPVATLDREILAYRPPSYGRALVVPVAAAGPFHPEQRSSLPDAVGFLDVKGVGVQPGRTPRQERHATGLLPLAEACEEFLIQRTLESIFRHSGSSFTALPLYGVVDVGYEIRGDDGRPGTPAGILVRRAHRRVPDGCDVPCWGTREHVTSLEIELLLRQYGLSSAVPCGELIADGEEVRLRLFDEPVRLYDDSLPRALWRHLGGGHRVSLRCCNVQLTAAAFAGEAGANEAGEGEAGAGEAVANVVDFGHYRVHARFSEPLLTQVTDRPLRWGGVLRPADPFYLQPRPELALPADRWGSLATADPASAALEHPPGPQADGVGVFADGLVRRYQAGEIEGDEILAAIEKFVARATARWP